MDDKIEFILFDPAIAGEEWAKGFLKNGSRLNGVKIMINDEDLLSIVEKVEKLSNSFSGRYGHATAMGLYDELTDEEEGYFMPLCCWSCGETGCCTFEGHWRQDSEWVYWERFSSNGLDDYNLNFRFAKADYDAELKKLESTL